VLKGFVSWSGGKDSCLSCYKAKGIEVVYLLNMVTIDAKRSMTHGISSEVLRAQSECIGVPIIQKRTTWDTYEQNFKDILNELKKRGVGAGIFGDIDLQEHRDWVERVCSAVGITSVLPLWGKKREEVLKEFMDSGFEAILVAAKADLFGREWLGRRVDKSFVRDLQKMDIDLCGENGEYHTFVTDGPMFKKRLKIMESEEVLRGDHRFFHILKYRYEDKYEYENKHKHNGLKNARGKL